MIHSWTFVLLNDGVLEDTILGVLVGDLGRCWPTVWCKHLAWAGLSAAEGEIGQLLGYLVLVILSIILFTAVLIMDVLVIYVTVFLSVDVLHHARIERFCLLFILLGLRRLSVWGRPVECFILNPTALSVPTLNRAYIPTVDQWPFLRRWHYFNLTHQIIIIFVVLIKLILRCWLVGWQGALRHGATARLYLLLAKAIVVLTWAAVRLVIVPVLSPVLLNSGGLGLAVIGDFSLDRTFFILTLDSVINLAIIQIFNIFILLLLRVLINWADYGRSEIGTKELLFGPKWVLLLLFFLKTLTIFIVWYVTDRFSTTEGCAGLMARSLINGATSPRLFTTAANISGWGPRPDKQVLPLHASWCTYPFLVFMKLRTGVWEATLTELRVAIDRVLL